MKNIRRGIIFVLVVFIVYIFISGFQVERFSRVDQARPADAAIVLGANVWGNQPSPVFAERINHAVWLYQQGYVDYIILTGGVSDGNKFSEAFIASEYVYQLGVPYDAVFIEESSGNTFENIYFASEIVKAHGMDSVVLVSDPLHMRRSIEIARNMGLQVYSSPTTTSLYKSPATTIPFLIRESFNFGLYRLGNIFRIK